MTLVLKPDPDIVMTYFDTKMRSIGQLVQTLSARNRKFEFIYFYDLDLEPKILILKPDL